MKTIQKILLAAVMLLALPLGMSAQKGGQWFIVGDFCDGMAYVKHQRTELYGYVNQSRKLVIPCKTRRVNWSSLASGLTWVISAMVLPMLKSLGAIGSPSIKQEKL